MFSDPILSPPFADGNIWNYIRPMMAMDMGINQINKGYPRCQILTIYESITSVPVIPRVRNRLKGEIIKSLDMLFIVCVFPVQSKHQR